MSWSRVALLALPLLMACGPPPAPKPAEPQIAAARPSVARAAVDPALYQLVLPEAKNTLSEPFVDAPNVIGSGVAVWVDEQPAGNVRLVLAEGRLQRIDPLFEILKARRAAWKTAHPGEEFHGSATLWFDRATPMLVFKSVFQTVAFAGYPNLQVAVRPPGSAPQTIAYQNFDAYVPRPNPQPSAENVALHVSYLESDGIELVWVVGDSARRTTGFLREAFPDPRFSWLGERVAEEWRRFGGHQQPQDRAWDQAVLRVPNRLDLATAMQLIDAIYVPKREFALDGKLVRVPAFNVTFKVN